jgi:hypothetical protein
MAYRVRNTSETIGAALVAANNLRQTESVASFFHADTTQKTTGHFSSPVVTDDLVTAANSSSEATGVALANDIKGVVNRHFADDLAHNTAVSAVVTTADAIVGDSLVTALALANAIKAALNVHYTAANVHFTNDATNTIAAANATDQASLNTLLNEIKTDLNAHIVSAPLGAMIRLTPA